MPSEPSSAVLLPMENRPTTVDMEVSVPRKIFPVKLCHVSCAKCKEQKMDGCTLAELRFPSQKVLTPVYSISALLRSFLRQI